MRNRRRQERYDVTATVDIGRPGGPPEPPIAVDNLSMSGLAFRSRHEWCENEHVTIRVHADRLLEIGGKILWCDQRSSGFKLPWRSSRSTHYVVGVVFEEGDDAHRKAVVDEIFQSDAYHGPGLA